MDDLKEGIQFLINHYTSTAKYLKIEMRKSPDSLGVSFGGMIMAYHKVIKDLKSLASAVEKVYVEREFAEKLLKQFEAGDPIEYWYKHYKEGNL